MSKTPQPQPSVERCNFTIEVSDEKGLHRARCRKPANHGEHDFVAIAE